MEQMGEMILKYGISVVFNIWFLLRLEKMMTKNNETNEKVLLLLSLLVKDDNK